MLAHLGGFKAAVSSLERRLAAVLSHEAVRQCETKQASFLVASFTVRFGLGSCTERSERLKFWDWRQFPTFFRFRFRFDRKVWFLSRFLADDYRNSCNLRRFRFCFRLLDERSRWFRFHVPVRILGDLVERESLDGQTEKLGCLETGEGTDQKSKNVGKKYDNPSVSVSL